MENIALIGIDLGKTLSIFIARIVAARLFTVKIYTAKVNRIFGDMPRQPSQWKPVVALTLWHASWKSWGIFLS
jgi:xanthosine utilization system XapX-like protein